MKKEFPNVTHKLISPPHAKKLFGKNTVAETSFRDEETETEKLVVYLQKKMEKIIVSVTVNSVAPLQKKHLSVTDICGN